MGKFTVIVELNLGSKNRLFQIRASLKRSQQKVVHAPVFSEGTGMQKVTNSDTTDGLEATDKPPF
jgi:hypothetical protein